MLPRTLVLLFSLAIAGFVMTVFAPTASARADYDELPFEVAFPQNTEMTTFSNDWGQRRSGGRRHLGNDLMAPKMTEVYALADGVIAKVNERARPGRYVIIDHGDGWESLYVHLNNDNLGTDDGKADWSLTLAPGVEEGVEVKAGQLIGWSGDSGNAEGSMPHTHFELSFDGREVNPYYVLSEAFGKDHEAFLWRQWAIENGIGNYEIA